MVFWDVRPLLVYSSNCKYYKDHMGFAVTLIVLSI